MAFVTTATVVLAIIVFGAIYAFIVGKVFHLFRHSTKKKETH